MCVQHVRCAKHKVLGVHCANVIQTNCEQCFSETSVLCAQAVHGTNSVAQCACSL